METVKMSDKPPIVRAAIGYNEEQWLRFYVRRRPESHISSSKAYSVRCSGSPKHVQQSCSRNLLNGEFTQLSYLAYA